jgi:hypothetical protein
MSHFYGMQRSKIRCEGGILYVPVRIHTNKVLTLEDLEKTKMYLHINAFKFRINELADRLESICEQSERAKTLQRRKNNTHRTPQDDIRDFVSSIMGKASAYMRPYRCLLLPAGQCSA